MMKKKMNDLNSRSIAGLTITIWAVTLTYITTNIITLFA